MARYVSTAHLNKGNPDFDWWKVTYGPGDRAPVSGIYRCEGCTREISHNEGVSLPAQNHEQHDPSQGPIKWKLIVRADTGGSK